MHRRVVPLGAAILLGLVLAACGDGSSREQKVLATGAGSVLGGGSEARLSLGSAAMAGGVVVPRSPAVILGAAEVLPHLEPAPVPPADAHVTVEPGAGAGSDAPVEQTPAVEAPVVAGSIEVRVEGVADGSSIIASLETGDGQTVTSAPVTGPTWSVAFPDLADGTYRVLIQLESPAAPPADGIDLGTATSYARTDFNIGVAAGTATTVYFDAASQTFTAVQ